MPADNPASFPYTLDDIAKAYEATGLRPVAGRFIGMDSDNIGAKCGCPMAVLACHVGNWNPNLLPCSLIPNILKISLSTMERFMAGFDETISDDDRHPIYLLGQAARARFLPTTTTQNE